MARKKALWTKISNSPVSAAKPVENESRHNQLVRKAAEWLFRTKRCSVVITEMCGGSTETPDAIGWKGHGSILVECKTSRSDFQADQKKISRRHTPHAIGAYRYYLTMPGIIPIRLLPPKWGLLEMQGSKVRLLIEAEYFDDTNHGYEKALLVSCLRRIGHAAPAGVSVSCYTYETKNRATLGVRKDPQ